MATTSDETISFPLMRHDPYIRLVARLTWASCSIVLLVNAALFFAGRVTDSDAIGLTLGLLGAMAVVAVAWGVSTGGDLTVDERGFEFGGGRGRERYAWTDIANLRMKTFRECGFLERVLTEPLLGIPAGQAFVELRLARSLRIGLWSTTGTDVVGIPTVWLKIRRVYVADPEAFVAEARKHLAS